MLLLMFKIALFNLLNLRFLKLNQIYECSNITLLKINGLIAGSYDAASYVQNSIVQLVKLFKISKIESYL